MLIEADEGLSQEQISSGAKVYGNVGTHALPAVFELNVVTGGLTSGVEPDHELVGRLRLVTAV